MPSNGRWDLIRRLKFNLISLSAAYSCGMSCHMFDVELFLYFQRLRRRENR